jgi:heme exporter protein A
MLEAQDVACLKGSRWLLRDVSFRAEPGEVLWIEGRNGSGKTTLLRILCGLTPPEEGEVRWDGTAIRKAGESFRHDLLYLGHPNALKDDLTIVENLRFALRLAGRSASSADLDAALERTGLADRRDLPARVLSQGQRRRAALARLWVDDAPRLWILDEPFAALDADSVSRLAARLGAHLAGGGIAVLTTHQEVPIPAGHVRRLRLGPDSTTDAGANGRLT